MLPSDQSHLCHPWTQPLQEDQVVQIVQGLLLFLNCPGLPYLPVIPEILSCQAFQVCLEVRGNLGYPAALEGLVVQIHPQL